MVMILWSIVRKLNARDDQQALEIQPLNTSEETQNSTTFSVLM
jgi:hypothetical protein